MARTFASPMHDALAAFLAKQRKATGLTQKDLAKKLKRSQDYVSDVETGQKIVGVVELMEWAEASGLDARPPLRALQKASTKA